MATFTPPFAYNPGAPISGTTQYEDLAVGNTDIDYSNNYGGVQWWASPEEVSGYIVGNARPSGQPVPSGTTGTAQVGFWRSKGRTDQAFLDLANYIGGKNGQPPFTTTSQAETWLESNGYYTSFNLPTPTPTVTQTSTPSITASQTVTPTPSITASQTVTPTPSITASQTVTPTPSITASQTVTPTLTTTPTTTPTPTPTRAQANGSVLLNNAATQYLSLPNSSAFTQNTSFTYECWFNPTSANGGYVFGMNQTNWITLKFGTDRRFSLDMAYVGIPPAYTNLNTVYALNTWYHVALTFNQPTSAGRLYVNGTQQATFSGATATVGLGNPFTIGDYLGITAPGQLGYYSNFRVVKGVAVYTAPFTVPTTNFTTTQLANSNGNPSAAITGATQTTLLLNTYSGANFLKDNSTNNFTVTNNGSMTSSALAPF